MPLLKIIRTQSENLVIVCDKELLGKTFRSKKLKLEIKERFYGGDEASVDECLSAIKSATIANLVGSIVQHAVKEGIISDESVFRFQDVLHAQLVKM